RGRPSLRAAAAVLIVGTTGAGAGYWHRHLSVASPRSGIIAPSTEARLLATAAREPNSPRPYRELAEEYAGRGRPASALWSYAEAAARAPGDDTIRLKLAAVTAQLGHVPMAEAAFRR